MKKAYLFLVMALGVMVLNAQTFKVYHNDVEVKDFVEVVPQEGGMSMDFFDIENISGADVKFKVQMIRQQMAEGTTLQMCFGTNCLTDTISDFVTLTAGEIMEHHFDLLYMYEDDVISTAVINFLNENDEQLHTFTVKYVVESDLNTLSQSERSVKLSAAVVPNPATTNTAFNYSVPANYKNAQLIVRNSLGSVVKQNSLKVGTNGKLNLNVADLTNGVYFYSIVADGATLVTKKLVVKH